VFLLRPVGSLLALLLALLTVVSSAGEATAEGSAVVPAHATRQQELPAQPQPTHSQRPTTSRSDGEVYWAPAVVETGGLLTVMRVTEAYLWPRPFSFYAVDHWPYRYGRAFTEPPKFDASRSWFEWDGDSWTINTIGHGLLGSELYLRPRRCGFGWLGSLGFATAATAIWEYGFEANGVHPSGLDLWFTPLSGIVLGEGRYQAWLAAGNIADPLARSVVRTVLDPIGEFSSKVVGGPC
jgi:hypothetical protein